MKEEIEKLIEMLEHDSTRFNVKYNTHGKLFWAGKSEYAALIAVHLKNILNNQNNEKEPI